MGTSLGRCCWPGRRVSQSPECWSSYNKRGKMREGGEDDDKGMVSDVERCAEPGWKRDVEFYEGWDLCLCGGAGGGSGVGGSSIGGSGGSCGIGDSGESAERIVYRRGGGGLSIVDKSGRGGLYRSG